MWSQVTATTGLDLDLRGARRPRVVNVVMAVMWTGLAIWTLVVSNGSLDRRVAVIEGLVAVTWIVLVLRPQMARLTGDGAIVRNRWKTVSVLWADVRKVDVLAFTQRGYLILRMRDGDSLRIDAAQSTREDPERAQRTARLISLRLTAVVPAAPESATPAPANPRPKSD